MVLIKSISSRAAEWMDHYLKIAATVRVIKAKSDLFLSSAHVQTLFSLNQSAVGATARSGHYLRLLLCRALRTSFDVTMNVLDILNFA